MVEKKGIYVAAGVEGTMRDYRGETDLTDHSGPTASWAKEASAWTSVGMF